MAGLTLQQLQGMGAKPAQPAGLTLQQLLAQQKNPIPTQPAPTPQDAVRAGASGFKDISNKIVEGETNTVNALNTRGKDIFNRVTTAGAEAQKSGATVPERILGAVSTGAKETIGGIAGGVGDILTNMISPFVPQGVKDTGSDMINELKTKWNTKPDATKDPQGAETYDKLHGLLNSLSEVSKNNPQTSGIIKDAITQAFNIASLAAGGEGEAAVKPIINTLKNTGEGLLNKTGQVVSDVGTKVADTASNIAEKTGLKASGAIDETKLPFSPKEIDSSLKPSQVKPSKALKAVQATEDTMNKAERLQAIEEGRVQTTKLGGKKLTPSETEVRASQILDGKVTGNPVKDIKAIKNEIATRGVEAERYLEQNAKPITNADHFNAFESKRVEASKYLTDSELKAYDEQVKMFSKQLPGRGVYDTNTYYKALKDYESNVADKLPRGKEALLDPTGVANAKIRAASDVRKVVRDMIGNKNPEFKDKMFDLASLYDVKDTVATKADKLAGNKVTRFIQKYPKTSAAIGGAAGAKLLGH